MKSLLKQGILADQSGQDTLEWTAIAALIVLVAIAVILGNALGRRPVVTTGRQETAIESTYLSALAMDWSSGLTLSALVENGESGEVGDGQ